MNTEYIDIIRNEEDGELVRNAIVDAFNEIETGESSSSNPKIVLMDSYDEFMALSEEERNNGDMYFVSDVEIIYGDDLFFGLYAGEGTEITDIITGRATTVVVNDIDSVRQYAFYLNSVLASVSFDMVESIGNYAFYSCTSLTSVSFPEAKTIGIHAFDNCISLKEAIFPEATAVAESAFYSCRSLSIARFPKVSSIGNCAFLNCSSIKALDVTAITSIGNSAFQNCYNLSTAEAPKLTAVAAQAFYSCSNLISVSFPLAKNIQQSAFIYCSNLTSVNIPEASFIGSNAFRSCSSLSVVSFPSVTSSIHNSAFFDCRALQSVYLLGSTAANLQNVNAFANTPLSNSTYLGDFGSIFVPESLLNTYKTKANWSAYSNRIVAY